MVKKTVNQMWERIQDRLRRLCGGLSPDARLITILSFCLVFGALSIYITVGSIYRIGKRDAEREFMEIQHIEQLDLQRKDSINTSNITE